jgi:hypothetical protein
VNKTGPVVIGTFYEREREGMLSRSKIGVMHALWKRNENDQYRVTESG